MKEIERSLDIARLLTKKHTGAQLTPAENRELDRWLARSEANRDFAEHCTGAVSQDEFRRVAALCDYEKVWRDVRKRTVAVRRRRRLAAVVASAGAAAAVVVAFLNIYRADAELPIIAPGGVKATISLVAEEQSRDFALTETEQEAGWQKYVEQAEDMPREELTVRITVPRGGEYHLTLGDGTRVWLNSESTIEYPENFTDAQRLIHLTGEAFFDVATDHERPFIVETEGQMVRVTGTQFNVSAYGSDTYGYTTLISGSVEVAAAGISLTLMPGQQAVVGETVEMRTVDTELYTSWMKGVFEFENMELRDICAQLERWYDVSFTFEGASGEERFTGGTWRYEPLNDLLKSIEMVTEVSFSRRDDLIVVSSK